MPRYNYYCKNCGKKEEVIRNMTEADQPWKCTACNIPMKRNYQADLPFMAGKDYKKPIVSDSLAVSISQIEEHKKLFPHIPITDQGQPVFTNYSDHEAYLKKTGFKKARQKIRRKGKRIA